MALINREDTVFIAIDYQEKLMPVMSNKEDLEDKVCRLAEGMKALGIPHIVTQQYTKGIGQTIPSVAEAIGEFTPIDKTSFSCMMNLLKASGSGYFSRSQSGSRRSSHSRNMAISLPMKFSFLPGCVSI